jgi:tetratricopeptide (TPR) repeat protein
MLVQQSLLAAVLGNPDAALRSAEAADAAARRVTDPAQQARALADAQFATAAVVLDRDPRYARQLLTAAIDTYQANNLVALIAEPYLLRARAETRLGDANAAAGDLEAGISTLERRRIQFAGPAAGTGVLDAGVTLYDDAVRLCLDRGDVAGAFAYAERAHAADVTSSRPASLTELEGRLAGSGVAVLELVVLPEQVVAFTVTEHGISAVQTKLVKRVFDYDTLIRPSERAISGARALVIVPDALLENIAFAGLYDGRHYLVEKLPLAIAPSAGSLHVVPRTAPRTITAIALPSGDDSHSVSLPETAAELGDVTHVYRQSFIVNENVATPAALSSAADVVHIAGHTERQAGLGDAALVFSGNERVSWKTIASTPQSPAQTVVLAACETLRRPNAPQARALSLGGAFLAAGAGNVVGTLTPIADTDARAIFRALHRELAAGVDPAEALRRAQIAAIAAQPSRPESWSAVELLTCNIPRL